MSLHDDMNRVASLGERLVAENAALKREIEQHRAGGSRQAEMLQYERDQNAAKDERIARLEAVLRDCVDDHQPQPRGRCSCGAGTPCPVRAEIEALLTEDAGGGAS